MKKKNDYNAEQLESLDSDLFRSFDPEEEMWLVGGSKTITAMATATPDGWDFWADMDYWPVEPQPQT
jgi:hypothetical protein